MKVKNLNFINACKKMKYDKKTIDDYIFMGMNLFLLDINDMKEIKEMTSEEEIEDIKYLPNYMIKNGGVTKIDEYNFYNGEYRINKSRNFDLDYFSYLNKKAKTSSEYTYKMIDYINKVGIAQLKYYLIGIIKISNIKTTDKKSENWSYVEEYKDYYKMKTIRDLWKNALINSFDAEKKEEAEKVLEWCKDFFFEKLKLEVFKENNFNLIAQVERTFSNMVEELLLFFDFKTANSIKVAFKIYSDKWIDYSQINVLDTNLTKIVKKYSDVPLKKQLYLISDYYEKNKKILSKLNNGYSALFELFMDGEVYE